MSGSNKINILTLNWSGEDKLKKLYPSLLNSLNNINYEWFLKDNNSKDNSVSYLKSLNNNNLNITEYKNNSQNFSEGMNYLFNVASPKDDDLILLLNNDVIFNDQTSVKNMINIIENDDSVGVVGARLLYTGTNKIQHGGTVFDNQYRMPFHFRANHVSDENAEKNREFQAVTGAVWLTKAKYYKNICTNNKSGINGMPEELAWAFDDVFSSLSIKYNMNKKIVYCGKTNIFHEESASLKKNPVNKMFLSHNVNCLKKHWDKRIQPDMDTYIFNPNYNLYKEIK